MSTETAPMSVDVAPKGPLTPEQGAARSAFINFCWNLQLATARAPDDPGLSEDHAATIRTMLETSNADTASEGGRLWQEWMATGGHAVCPAIFTEQDMLGFVARLETERGRYEQRMAFRATIAGKATVPFGGVQ